MRICVARGTGAIFKSVNRRVFYLCCRSLLVAITTGDRDVSSGQHKPGLLVLRQSEGGRPIPIYGVALLAAVQVRHGCELSLMLVLVAIQAARELDPVEGRAALGDVTLGALHRGVLGFERVSGRGVLFDTKFCRFESLYCMAGGAFPSICALYELTLVLILVAIHALLEGDRSLEIAAPVALEAINALMFPHQRIFGLGVIKALVERRSRNPLPATCVVARLAALLSKTSPVWVAMAVRAFSKRQTKITRLVVRSGRVALLATHLGVQSRQRIASFGMVKLSRSNFPVVIVVALQAILA